jgi:DNA-binding response OmpR family regulator
VTTSAGKRILIVEDEALIAMLVEDLLSDMGFQVVGPAMTLDRGLSLARSEQLDAAILDVNLGGVWSYPIADLLVARGIPFLFASGYDAPALGWNDRATIVRKPFDHAVLASALQKLVPSG